MSELTYEIDETGNQVYEIPISLIAKETQLDQDPETVTIGWYTDYHGVRGDIAIRMGLVEESETVHFDYTEPTQDQLKERYGNTMNQY
jgi:hypothetical protein|tara:strand:+ start:209 stop:472 length:264 start_codon:yes stop_codon:yes gene_type:complete